jgi:SAM-dependent MidA family methyltransferase
MTQFKTELEKRLIERIKRQGQMTFCEFMQTALYDAEFGYYNNEGTKIGISGDFYTSSNVHPAFGAILAKAFVELSKQLNDKNKVTLIEIGAGTGQLAFDILKALREEEGKLFEQIRYIIVEQSPAMRARQKDKLQAFAEKIKWRELQELEPITGIIFSNELVDAMPVHRVRFSHNSIAEQFVIVEKKLSQENASGAQEKDSEAVNAVEADEKLALVWGKLSNAKLAEYIQRTGVRFVENQVIEINLAAIDWLEHLSEILKQGFFMTIDYGDLAAHLYSPDRREGTLRCFYKHTLTDSVLARIGLQDITASVNFSALIDYGKDYGFEKVSYERQTNFLFRFGLIERIAAMENAGTLDNLKDRLAIKNLLAPGGVSDNFRVLIQKRVRSNA